ncbi:hypothetical protein D4R47_04620 [archaeon]|nr:MAG: hypothetical protein D4R47_04620 [archaeon]
MAEDKKEKIEVVTPVDKTVATPDADTKVSQSLSDELDAAVEATMTDIEKERKENEHQEPEPKGDDKKIDLPPAKDQYGDVDSGGKAPEDGKDAGDDKDTKPDEDGISDELLDSSAKAGLKIADAKRYPDADMLTHVCERLEEIKQGDDKSGDSDDNSGEPEVKDLLASIPDLDPADYDENVVAAFKALKAIVGQQQEVISGLKVSGTKNEQSWFDSKTEGLGESFEKAFAKSPDKRVALKEQFDAMTAGYESTGKVIEPETVFNQALQITLGDVVAEAANTAKAGKVAKRSTQHVSRPGGTKTSPTSDVFEDVAADLDRKFFNKT